MTTVLSTIPTSLVNFCSDCRIARIPTGTGKCKTCTKLSASKNSTAVPATGESQDLGLKAGLKRKHDGEGEKKKDTKRSKFLQHKFNGVTSPTAASSSKAKSIKPDTLCIEFQTSEGLYHHLKVAVNPLITSPTSIASFHACYSIVASPDITNLQITKEVAKKVKKALPKMNLNIKLNNFTGKTREGHTRLLKCRCGGGPKPPMPEPKPQDDALKRDLPEWLSSDPGCGGKVTIVSEIDRSNSHLDGQRITVKVEHGKQE